MKHLALVLLLAGCAADPAKLQQQAINTPTDELCYIRVAAKYSGQVRQAAFTELQRRGNDCSQSWQYVNARMQSDADHQAANIAQQQATTAALQAVQRSFVQPAPIQPIMNGTSSTCTVRDVGGGTKQVNCQ